MDTIWAASITLMVILLFVVACGAAYYLSVLVHELGHITAACLVGWTPNALSIGFGRRRTVFSIRGVEFQVGSRFIGGLAYATANDFRWFRTKHFLFVLGGPLATAGLAAMFLASARADTNYEIWFEMLFWAQLWMLVLTLWPQTISMPPEELPSDGLWLWRTLWMKKAEAETLWFAHAFQKLRSLSERESSESAFSEGSRLLSLYQQGSQKHVQALDMMACIPVFSGCRALLAGAFLWIEQAIEYSPEDITLQGTKGSLMIEAGNLTEGIALLEHVRDTSESDNDQAIVTWYLALAYLKRGDLDLAQQMLAEAKEKHAHCIVAPRLSDEIAAISKEACARLVPEAAA